MKIRFFNGLILDLEREDGLFLGEVCTDSESGLITYVGDIRQNVQDDYDRNIDLDGNILMPGFVDAHTHSAMALFKGIKEGVSLEQWLFDNIFPLEAKLTNDDIYYGTKLACLEYIKNGITTVDDMYHLAPLASAKAFSEMNLRARVSIMHFEKEREDENNALFSLAKEDKNITLSSTIHAIYTTGEEQIDDAVNFAHKHNLNFSSHLSETLKEVNDCINEHKKTPPEYLESFGFFDRPCTLYHCVHVDKDDAEILRRNNCSVVTCPSSNLKLASGVAPIVSFKNAGINIAIGTDGSASNDRLDMFKEMFLVATLNPCLIGSSDSISAKDVLGYATCGGAKSLGIDNLGEIKEGYFADLIVVNTKSLNFIPKNDYISDLVYSACASDVCLTMCGGKVLYENGNYTGEMNENEIIKKCEEIIKRLKEN